jgi:hypothetical protein
MGMSKNEQWLCACTAHLDKVFEARHDVLLARLATSWILMKPFMRGVYVEYTDEFIPRIIFACAGVRRIPEATIMSAFRPDEYACSPVALGIDEPSTTVPGKAVQKEKPVFYLAKAYFQANRYSGSTPQLFFFRKVAFDAGPPNIFSKWLSEAFYTGLRRDVEQIGPSYTEDNLIEWVSTIGRAHKQKYYLERVTSGEEAAIEDKKREVFRAIAHPAQSSTLATISTNINRAVTGLK